jgi:methylphosphotriester-DNA--protein-cysteine methyltransferase
VTTLSAAVDRDGVITALAWDQLEDCGAYLRAPEPATEREGLTFSAFILDRRLSRAHRFLSEPRLADRKISSVAFDVGFGDLSYFNRVFRRRYGATPSEIRRAAKRGDLPH